METNDLRLYDQLLQFPLFQGMSRDELLQLAGNTRFGFQKLSADKFVVRESDECDQLLFLISGQVTITSTSDDRSYSMTEWITAPWVIQPEVLFGAATRYTQDIRTVTEAHLIMLSKSEVLRLLDDFLIFRLNLLNLLSTLAQRRNRQGWRRAAGTLSEHIARFFTDHSVYPAGRKELHILMQQLAREMGDTRLNVSRVLNEMQQRQLLTLHRGRIVIPLLERLFM